MTQRKDPNATPTHAHAPFAAALAAVLAACSAQSSPSSTAELRSSAAGSADPPARQSDLPEIVVTARAPHPEQRDEEGTKAPEADTLSLPSDIDIGKRPDATEARAPSAAADESG
jgi:hypothetical protein